MGSAVGQKQPDDCNCPSYYNASRKAYIISGWNPDCDRHGTTTPTNEGRDRGEER